MPDSTVNQDALSAPAVFVRRFFQTLAGRNPYAAELDWAKTLAGDADREPVTLLGNLIYQYQGGVERLPVRALIESASLFSEHFRPGGEHLSAFLNVIDGALSSLEHRASVAGVARTGDGSAALWALNPLEYNPQELTLAGIVRAAPRDSVRLWVNGDEIDAQIPLKPGFSIHRIALKRTCKAGDRIILRAADTDFEFVLADDGRISDDSVQSALARLQRDAPPASLPDEAGCFLNRYRQAAKLPASDSINADNWPFKDHLAIYRTLRRLSPDLIVEDDYVRTLSQIVTINNFEAPLIFFLEFWKDRQSGLFAQLRSAERWRRGAAIADRIMPGGWRWLKLGLDVDCANLVERPWTLYGLPINRWAAHRLDKAGQSHAQCLSRTELAGRLLSAATHAIAAGCGDRLVPPAWRDFIAGRLPPSEDAKALQARLSRQSDEDPVTDETSVAGVAVIGETERSLGAVAASAVKSLKTGDHPVQSVAAAGFIRGAARLRDDTGTVLFCANAQRILDMYASQYTALKSRRTVAFPFWETTRFPDLHARALSQADRVVTATHFVEAAVRAALGLSADVVTIGLPISIPAHLERKPTDGPFSFLSIGDVHSGLARKNMLGSIQAFQRAFPSGREARLVLKIRSIDENHWGAGEDWPLIQEIAGKDNRIEIVLGDLPPEDYWKMISQAHGFLSLHRGEGFGYGLAHSLRLGIPVISTDFSGPRDFCTPETAYPVPAKLVPVPYEKMDQTVPLGEWAEPDLDAAAEQMRAMSADYDSALARAQCGRERVEALYSEAVFHQRLTAALEF